MRTARSRNTLGGYDGAGRRRSAMSEHDHEHDHTTTRGYSADKVAGLKRLHRVEGQVRVVAPKVEDIAYCTDFLTLSSYITQALQQYSYVLTLDETYTPLA